MDLKEQQLIAQIKNGDDAAFGSLVNKYQGMVATVVKNMIHDDNSADDVGQEVFIRLYKALPGFRGDSQLSTYITRIAINLSINEINRNKKRRFEPLESSRPEQLGASDHQETRDTRELIRAGLQNMDEKHRAVIVLRMIEGYSTKEAAELLNVPEGTVLSRLSRGMKQLKEALLALGYEHSDQL